MDKYDKLMPNNKRAVSWLFLTIQTQLFCFYNSHDGHALIVVKHFLEKLLLL